MSHITANSIFLVKSKQTLRFDGKIRLLKYDSNFSRQNSLVTLKNPNKHSDLTEKIQLLQFDNKYIRNV